MKDNTKKEADRISKLRLEMLQAHPFWGYLLLQIKILPAPELPCFAATDCVHHIWYNPLKTQHLNHAQLGFVLAHELGHQIYATHSRRGRRNAQLWNCATDYAINRIVAQISHPVFPRRQLYQVPEGKFPKLGKIKILLDEKYTGMIAETIYDRLDAEQLPDPKSCEIIIQLDSEGGEIGEGGAGNEASDENSSQGPCIRIPNLTDHGGGIDIHLPESLSQDDIDEIESRIHSAVEHWQQQSGRGHAPVNLLSELEWTASGRVDWRSVFRSYTQTALSPDQYSLRRPHRRYLELDYVVPSLHGERVPHVMVSIDSSGSMTAEMIQEVGRELKALSQTVEQMTLIIADHEVLDVIEDQDMDRFLAKGQVRGGRGTDHRPVFQWIEDSKTQPDLYVGLTDLCSRFPAQPPNFPVLWLTPYDQHPLPPWGTVIEVSNIDGGRS